VSHPGQKLTVQALLDTPAWRDAATLVAGRAGTGRDVRAVKLLPQVRGALSVPAGSLVVVAGIDRADWRIDTLLSRLAEEEAAGLLLPCPAGLQPLNPTLAVADRLGLPLMTTHGDALALAVDLGVQLAHPRAVRAGLVLRAHSVFARPPTSIDELATTLSRVLGQPAAILDADGVILAGRLPGDVDLVPAVPTAHEIGVPGGVAILYPVPADGDVAGHWLAAWAGASASVRADGIRDVLQVASTSVRELLASTRLALERDAHRRATLFADIIRAGAGLSVATRRLALDAGWTLEGWHTGIRIGAAPESDLVGLRATVAGTLRECGSPATVVEYGDGWSAWTTVASQPNAATVRDHSARVRHAQRRLRTHLETSVGVGRPYRGAGGIARSLGEATDAARLAAGRRETGRFLHIDRLGLAQLLLAWTRTDTFMPAAQELLAPLADQPGDLLRTLSVFLDSESSYTETAAILGVHRNTVAARIERALALINVDLDAADERLSVHLACRTALHALPD
jgi:PucR family transcriptional regulator, purine catabolism regulatory protein